MKIHTLQTSFITGQLDEAAQARSETALYKNGAAALRNCEPIVTGGVKTRRGTRHLGYLTGPAVIHPFEFSLSQSYAAAFQATRVDFFYADTGLAAGSLTGCPWQADWLRELRTEQLGDVMWVWHPAMWPQVIRRTGTASWSIANWTADDVRGWPTYRYAPSAITGQSGGGVARIITLSATPTIDGADSLLTVGMYGQARLAAGPGPWVPFQVAAVAGLALTVNWLAPGLIAGSGLEVQLEGTTEFGGGPGEVPADPGSGWMGD